MRWRDFIMLLGGAASGRPAEAARHDPKWVEYFCANHHVVIGQEDYLMSESGYLMPTPKDQPPPDLRNFQQAGK